MSAVLRYETKLGKLPTLTGTPTHYCAGCEHGTLTRLLASAVDARGARERAVLVSSVGCSVLAHEYLNLDAVQAPHGRAPAVMAGIKRVRPDLLVFGVQGDGDAVSIGLLELMNAANRGEPISIFLVNNAIYGMTGGQMAPTTPPGMVTTTTPAGRDVASTGRPIDATKLLLGLEGPSYIRRVFLPVAPTSSPDTFNARGALEGEAAIRHAFETQERGGFSFVEFVSTCWVNWKVSILESKRYAARVLAPLFPPGLYRDRFGVEGR